MNTAFQFCEAEIPGLLEITPFHAEDARGCFTKDYAREIFAQNGISYELQEVFYTTSHRGVIRALHFQRVKQQPKLIRCIYGRIFDVVVDLRSDSPAYRRWLGFDLSGERQREILIPAGCAHGYLVLESAIVSYKCAERFYGEYDTGILWNDPEIGVEWPLEQVGGEDRLLLSEKDRQLPTLQEYLDKYGAV